MKKITFLIIMSLISMGTILLRANPIPKIHAEPVIHVPTPEGFHSLAPDDIENWKSVHCPNWPQFKLSGPYHPIATDPYFSYTADIEELWLRYHNDPIDIVAMPVPFRDGRQHYMTRVTFSAPFGAREKFYLSKQKDLYNVNFPYCLTQKTREFLQTYKQTLEDCLSEKESDILSVCHQGTKKDWTQQLAQITQAEKANTELAAQLGLDLNQALDPLRDPSVSFPNLSHKRNFLKTVLLDDLASFWRGKMIYLLPLGLIVITAIFLFRRKKNLPK